MAIEGADIVAKNIRTFGGSFLKHVNKTMVGVGTILDKEVNKNISLTCHDLEDLYAMGHPYARRHGPRGIPIHDPYWQVHVQTGTLLSAKFGKIKAASVSAGRLIAGAYVGINETSAPHAACVIWGTSRMIPRDFLIGSLNNIKKAAFNHLRNNLRDMVMKFKPSVETS